MDDGEGVLCATGRFYVKVYLMEVVVIRLYSVNWSFFCLFDIRAHASK